MVKSLQTRPGAFPRLKQRVVTPPGGTPYRPGRTPKPELAKTGRLVMRLHPDLPGLLDLRAEEKGFSRAKFIEHVLIGYLNNDPRNPTMSLVGRIDRTKASPLDQREADPHKFAARWQRYVAAHQAIFGHAPPIDAEDPERFWYPHEDGATEVPEEQIETVRTKPKKK